MKWKEPKKIYAAEADKNKKQKKSIDDYRRVKMSISLLYFDCHPSPARVGLVNVSPAAAAAVVVVAE